MDTLTHIALGAVVGEAAGGKKLGKHALLLGAAAQSLPDVDFLASLWMSPADNLLAHRGFTHSFLFVVLATPALVLFARRWYREKKVSPLHWTFFFSLQLCIHLIIDSFNAYGVGWLEPFSHWRVAFHVLFVVDPFFSSPLGLAALALIILGSKHPFRKVWTRFGLIASALYVLYAISNKVETEQAVREAHKRTELQPERSFTTPTPLNSWLWYAVAEADSGFYISYHFIFDSQPNFDRTFFHKNEQLLNPVLDHEELKRLKRFSQGYYTIEQWGDTLVFNDLRFGQMAGWKDPQAKFVFHYFLQHPDENKFVVQRGRFALWDIETAQSLIQRIKGN
ncbi:MAG: metal-dependent hydrolase [Flammeovirgaceae bacterium]|nr:metal-dependent hydrolase [Flammeovirgaceae bacterium]